MRQHAKRVLAIHESLFGIRRRFFNVVDLVNKLDAEARTNRQGGTANLLCRLDICDYWGGFAR